MSLLILEDISKEYRNKVVLDGVSLRVERGEILALVGPNGSGKSTLLKIALGLESCDSGNVIIARNIKVGYISQDVINVDNRGEPEEKNALHYENIVKMEQDLREIEKQLESCPVGSKKYSKLMSSYSRMIDNYEAADGYVIESKIKRILLGLGLREEALSIPLSKLSGGEKMRVAIARVLLESPDLLILDEPTNHLDIQATEWLEGFLKKYEGGVLVVSHDRYFLDEVSTRVAELENGGITIKAGNYSTFIKQKQIMRDYIIKEQRHLNWNLKKNNKLVQELKAMGKHKAWKSRENAAKRMCEKVNGSMSTITQKEHLHKALAPKIAFKKIKHTSKDIAWADNLYKNFGNVPIFNGASMHIGGGERVGIIGPNGCGKTTLINILLGNDTNYSGIAKLGEWVKYSYMGQEILFVNEDRSILEEILLKKELNESEAMDILSRFQFYGDEVNKQINVLSGGEKVRLFLACIMLEASDCLIMDEPTNHLDVPARDAIESALNEFRGTIIAVTHDRYFLNNSVNRILEISNGKIKAYNGNYEFYKNEKAKVLNELESKVANEKARNYKNERNKINAKIEKEATQKINELKKIEDNISIMEKTLNDMVESFDESTTVEGYHEYDTLQKELDHLYSTWEKLME